MIMYSVAAKKQVENSDPEIAEMIIVGFTGQLKNWWDKCLTEQGRQEIKTARKIVTYQQNNQLLQTSEPDAVNTLLCTIYSHFIGDTSSKESRNSELLLNLRCRTLTDLEWYKDTFLSRVYEREDCKSAIWKEKFIQGLPKHFGQLVMDHIKGKAQGHLNLENFTYGQLMAEIKEVGLRLCHEMKWQKHIKRERLAGRKEMAPRCRLFATWGQSSKIQLKVYQCRL